jgi:undecaprenyl-diphosphatase
VHPSPPTARHRPHDAAVAAAAFGLLGLVGARPDRHPPWESALFDRLNRAEVRYRPLRLAQQLGTPWALPATAVVALAVGRPRLAVRAAVALPVEKALEVGLKKVRPAARPVWVRPTVLRDDAPVEGGSFPSGHAALAVALATITAREVPFGAAVLVAAAAVLSAVTRIHQGAHHPRDAVGGALLGVGVARALAFAVGRDTP